MFEVFEHGRDGQRFGLAKHEAWLFGPGVLSDGAKVTDFLVVSFDLVWFATCGAADGFDEKGLANAELETLVVWTQSVDAEVDGLKKVRRSAIDDFAQEGGQVASDFKTLCCGLDLLKAVDKGRIRYTAFLFGPVAR